MLIIMQQLQNRRNIQIIGEWKYKRKLAYKHAKYHIKYNNAFLCNAASNDNNSTQTSLRATLNNKTNKHRGF
jgi:hypothetical protein